MTTVGAKKAARLLINNVGRARNTPEEIRNIIETWYKTHPDNYNNQIMVWIKRNPRLSLESLSQALEVLGMFPGDSFEVCQLDLVRPYIEDENFSKKLYETDIRSWVQEHRNWLRTKYTDDRLEWIWRFGWMFSMYPVEPLITLYQGVRGAKPYSLGASYSFHDALVHERKLRRKSLEFTVPIELIPKEFRLDYLPQGFVKGEDGVYRYAQNKYYRNNPERARALYRSLRYDT